MRDQRQEDQTVKMLLMLSVVVGGTWVRIARADQAVSIVPFGEITRDKQGQHYGVIWEDPRDVARVVVVFADGAEVPDAGSLRLEYWQSMWPQNRIPRDKPSGAGGSGWLEVGDWFQGKWQAADAKLAIEGKTCAFTFNPVNAKEFKDLRDFAAEYRTTLKLRIASDKPLPEIKTLEVYTDSAWKPLDFEVLWGGTATNAEQTWDGSLEVFNGTIESLALLSAKDRPLADHKWQSRVKDKMDGITARIIHAEPKGYNSFDETVVTVRAKHETFSLAASDLIKHGHIFLPDFGVIIRKAGDAITYVEAERQWRANRYRNIYRRVFDVPEQTLTQAWNDMPIKDCHVIPLSFEGGRQAFGVEANGSVFCSKNWIKRLKGKDTERCLWEGDRIEYGFGLPDSRPVERFPVDGYLPMIVAAWDRDGVRYRQTVFVIPLMGVPSVGGRIWADDTLVALARIEMEKIGSGEKAAALDITAAYGGNSRKLALSEDGTIAEADKPDLRRMLVTPRDLADAYELAAQNERITYRAKLTDQSPTRGVDVAIPYVVLTDAREWSQLKGMDFDEAFGAVADYWKARVQASMEITTPEPMINDFHRALACHLLINTEREVGVSDRYMPKVGTFHYGVYANESCMMLNDLDCRGYHELAERALETWLYYQGSVSLPGSFSTAEGQLYGAGGYEAGGYNMHHGWVLHTLGEHYFMTRDKPWLQHAAPYMVKGCDWIINERQRTTEEAKHSSIRAIGSGLLPYGCLEDIGDWRGWMSTNVYAWWGMDSAARALLEIGHPDGQRLLDAANAYGKDILAGFTEAMRRSPVVSLRDGSWIPHMPSDVHRRGRSFGWITETLEGAIHIVRTGLVAPDSRLATWIIQDFEDNLYLSEQYGYNLTGADYKRYWFSRGGISMQANLLHNPIPYLMRDETKHFLRAYFNAFAVSYFPDTRMMTEHALPNIGDWRGDHYKSSDEANSAYYLRLMFIQERGDELWLGAAIPRYWLTDGQRIGIERAATRFGPTNMRMTSELSKGQISMSIDPPRRNPPKLIRARFRHPDGLQMKRVLVNDQPYDRFDPQAEWVELENLRERTNIVAVYE